MSRSHAEVRLLVPSRKIVIKDMKSMHGTYVNGLQLAGDETAELTDGTEVTFGSEVTRGDEIFPPKTFRCGVEWEEIPLPKPVAEPEPAAETPKSRGGYGICEDLLISDYEVSEEEGEEEEGDDELDPKFHRLEEEKTSGSGVSSTPGTNSAAPGPGQTTFVGASTSYMIPDDELPISHERSTKDMSVESLTQSKDRVLQLKRKIDEMTGSGERDVVEVNAELVDIEICDVPARPGVTIGSLMNQAQESSVSRNDKSKDVTNESGGSNMPECLVIDDEESDLEIIPEEAFKRYHHTSRTREHAQNDEIENSDMDESDDEDTSCRARVRSRRFNYVSSDESENEDEDEDDEEDDEDLEEEEQDGEDGGQHENAVGEHTGKASTANDTVDVTMVADNLYSPNAPTPVPPPEVLSSKPQVVAAPLGGIPQSKTNFAPFEELANAAVAAQNGSDSSNNPRGNVAASATIPEPPTLPPLTMLPTEAVAKKTPSGASHIHWFAEDPHTTTDSFQKRYNNSSMEQKKEYFTARQINLANLANRPNDVLSYLSPVRGNSKSPSVSQPLPPASLPWVQTFKTAEGPKEPTGLFPKVWEDRQQDSQAPANKSDKPPAPSPPPPTVTPQAKRLLEDAVAEGEKFRGLDKSTWWLGDEAEISIDETSEMVWDDEYCNDEDGEYDEEDEEEDEEENGNTPDDIPEQEMTDGIVDYEEEDEEEGEGDVMEEEDDTDSRHPTCTWFGQRKAFNTGYERFPVHHPNAGRGDFSKSRGFSISNLVHENNGPLTPPGPLMVATASSPPPGPSANGLISPPSTETKKEKSVADLLNPSSPSTGSKRKHSLLSDITPEEKSQEEEEVAHESPENMDETDDDVEEEDKMDSMTKVSTQELAMLFPGKNVQALEEEMETITLEPALPTPDGTSDEEEAIQAGEEEERPRKRARTTRPKKQFAKLAATALAGAIVGGVGVFAALVASAP
ncbi:unnamed protein product [Tuber melanosporum]|uniref:(Perigord truffle) hypothetical protein n=1 Tax=Tuber melanosporum (strain Mel28) TaxID=656061 RepID=D5GAL4_TUBMM|nr:uncharacterized protein GSTUM_00003670001 [Tuber melanosporum]CAZ81557.1 unnamed protein product [Tuber melanosporum]